MNVIERYNVVVFGARSGGLTVAHTGLKWRRELCDDEVARRTRTTFLLDPILGKGRITVLAPGEVTPVQAFELLRSALALHGYAMVTGHEGVWIVPRQVVTRSEYVVRVVRLEYADAGEIASTLSWVAPLGARVAPHFPTNSLVIAGYASDVEQLLDAVRHR